MAAIRAKRMALAVAALFAAACANGIATDSHSQEVNQGPIPGEGNVPEQPAEQPAQPPADPDAGHPHHSADASAPPDAGPADTGPSTCSKTLTIPSVSLSDSVC